MSAAENLLDDARYLLKKVAFLDGQDLKSLCRDLDLPVMNMAAGDMIDQISKKVLAAAEAYSKMPDGESKKILSTFRYNMLVKSRFLERYLDRVKRSVAV
ncbi:MAG: hypothetical protein HPY89_07420 [Pelotomaculum sp.]|uniref:Uncharacterized protein n=1 Tax=Pelotomaculum thermopropionicum (strain DSM 13744 / JCM 10971 / SI) TaxID=370438 RepID=A5D4I0_PELTS|nr:hypothetical protein [Pelotomaculum sp.]BAF58840.1 hypothetical protein PTH_0659 [Pelotomaculum thermopropionicum SI]